MTVASNSSFDAACSPSVVSPPRGDEFSASANVAALLGKKASPPETACPYQAAEEEAASAACPDEQHSMSSLEAIQPGSSTSNGLAKTPTTTTAVIKGTTTTKTIKTRRSSAPSMASKEPQPPSFPSTVATATVTTYKSRKTSAPNPPRRGRSSGTSGWRPRRTSTEAPTQQRQLDQEVAKVASASASAHAENEDEDCGRLI